MKTSKYGMPKKLPAKTAPMHIRQCQWTEWKLNKKKIFQTGENESKRFIKPYKLFNYFKPTLFEKAENFWLKVKTEVQSKKAILDFLEINSGK